MCVRTLFFIALSCMQVCIMAMEDNPRPPQHRFEEKTKSWPLQDVVTLESSTPWVRSSIMFFVPKDGSQLPFIGYLICSCNRVGGLAYNREHRQTILAMFESVLEKLASRGFDKVRFTRKLYESPECIASIIKDPEFVPIIEKEGMEVVISTDLTPKS